MPVLAKPDTIAGPLTAADLSKARAHSTGSIWRSPHRLDLHGTQWPDTIPVSDKEWACEWESCTGNNCHAGYRACRQSAPEGGAHHDPAPAMESMWRHRRARSTVALAVMLAVAGFAAHMIWPLV